MPRPFGLAHDQLHVVVFGDGEGEREWNFALALEPKDIGALHIEPLWPGPQGSAGADPRQFNHRSTPLRVTWNDVRLLLGADLPAVCWGRLVDAHGRGLADNDVLKAAHHGSRSSQHPDIVRAVAQHRVTTARLTSRLPDFRDGHGVELLLAGGNRLHCTALSFDCPAGDLSRLEGRGVQYPATSGFGTTVPVPPRASAPDSWHVTTFDGSGAVACSSGSMARHVTG